jgi:penicillin-binding protein 2
VHRHDDLAEQAESNRTAVVPIVPNRGLILDRNGVVLATNYSAYTLEITPPRRTTWRNHRRLAEIIEIQQRDRRRFKRLMEETKALSPCPSAPA